jgi:TrmH family RNA methyltransferase
MLSRSNKNIIKSLYKAHGRKKYNLCICEGVRCCGEYIQTGRISDIKFFITSDNFTVPEIYDIIPAEKKFSMPKEEFDKLTPTKNSQGLIIVTEKPEIPLNSIEINDREFIIILDKISDPGNMGTIIRTVKAAGLKKLFITAGCADPFSEKVIRSALAAQFQIEIIRLDGDLAELLFDAGIKQIWRTDCHQGVSLFDAAELYDSSAIIFGSEAFGVQPVDKSRSVTIPMPGNSESLNVAQAVTIFVFEAVRRGIFN